MKRTPARIAIATVMTASIGLAGAGAVNAAPKPVTTKSAKIHKSVKVDRRTAAEARLVAAAKRNALRDIARKALALNGAETRVAKANLGVTETAAVKANIAADKAVLADYRASIDAAHTRTAVLVIDKAVNSFRVENYDQVRGLLAAQNRVAAKVGAVNRSIVEVTAEVDTKAESGADVTAARAALAAAEAKASDAARALDAADAKALTVRAITSRKGVDTSVRSAHLNVSRATYALAYAQKKVEEARALVAVGPAQPGTATPNGHSWD